MDGAQASRNLEEGCGAGAAAVAGKGLRNMCAAPRSPIMMAVALVLPLVTIGQMERSTTRRLGTPCTFSSRSVTEAARSWPSRHVPVG